MFYLLETKMEFYIKILFSCLKTIKCQKSVLNAIPSQHHLHFSSKEFTD